MQLKNWTMDRSLEELKIDIENFRRNGVMTAAGRFLIGMQLEAEKARNREKYGRSKGKEAERHIAGELNIAQISVRRYARYARAVEAIREERPELAAELLSGERKLSIQKVVEIAEKGKNGGAVPGQSSRKKMENRNNFRSRRQSSVQEPCLPVSSVKDMPIYDPDAEFTGLTLTVPSWTSSIRRVRRAEDGAASREVSHEAKAALAGALVTLQEEIQNMLRVIKEG